MVGAEPIFPDPRSSPTLSMLMTHEMDPTVKIWLGYGKDKEHVEKAILFNKGSNTITPTWRANCR